MGGGGRGFWEENPPVSVFLSYSHSHGCKMGWGWALQGLNIIVAGGKTCKQRLLTRPHLDLRLTPSALAGLKVKLRLEMQKKAIGKPGGIKPGNH